MLSLNNQGKVSIVLGKLGYLERQNDTCSRIQTIKAT